MADNIPSTTPPGSPKGYGKRPLWQWVVLYLVIGGVLYFIIYYLFIADGSGGY